jgi:HlyD family secretion protein
VTSIRQTPQTIQDAATYDVVITAPNADLLLEPGMTATTRIVVGRRDDVVRAPDQALRYSPGAAGPNARPDGASRLWVLRDGKPIAISVEFGFIDGAYAEVVGGDLQLGDDLIIAESRSISKWATPPASHRNLN